MARRDKSEGHYGWSFRYGGWPLPDVSDRYFAELAADPAATRDWFDVLTRVKRPSDVETPERLAAWLGSR